MPESSSSLEFPSNEAPVMLSDKHNRTGITVQECASRRVKAGDVEEKPDATDRVEISTSRVAQKQFALTTLNTKIKKGPGLRKRVSNFFIGPHNAFLEPRRVINQFAPPTKSPKYVLLKVSDNTHRPALLEEELHTSCLSHVQPIYEDRSSIAADATPEKSLDKRHESCSGRAPAKPGHHNMRLPESAQHGPFSKSLTDEAYARIAGSLPSGIKMSDQVNFDSRHGSGPIRGLYRQSQTHHDHLMRDRLAQPASKQQVYDTTVWNGDNDWAISPANSDNSLKDLLKAIPAANVGARKLAALNPGHRGGVIISSTPFSRSASQLTAVDMDNASRERHFQPSGSVADANAEFHARKDDFSFGVSDHVSVSVSSSTDPCDGDFPCVVAGAGRGHTSLIPSDAFDHAVRAAVYSMQTETKATTTILNPKHSRSRSRSRAPSPSLSLPLPPIPTGSDILRAAAADPHTDPTPIAFRTYLSDVPFPDDQPSHLAHGRMVSTSQPPLPLALAKYVGQGKYEYAGEPSGRVNDGGEDETASWEDADESEATPLTVTATTPPPPSTLASATPNATNTTTRILRLVHALEDQRDELINQNRALLTAVEHARVLLLGAEAAYDAAEKKNKKIMELERKNRQFRAEAEGETRGT